MYLRFIGVDPTNVGLTPYERADTCNTTSSANSVKD